MNDISAIIQKILEDAKEYETNVASAAAVKEKEIVADYEKQAEQASAQVIQAAERQAEVELQRAQSQSGIEERNQKLRARRQAMDRAFEKAVDSLCASSKEKKVEIYSRLATQAVSSDASILLNAEDQKAIGSTVVDAVNQSLKKSGKPYTVTLSDEAGAFRGGLVLCQGHVDTNCTFEVLCANLKEQLEAEVAAILFS